MLSFWQGFSANIRAAVVGSRVVAEMLKAILDGDRYLVTKIMQESLYDPKLNELVRQVQAHSTTLRGRVEITRLMEEHLFISGVPVDDMSLRRVYLRWKDHQISQSRATGVYSR